MEKPPQFIKEFSKEESPEERQQTAQAIKAERAEHFTKKRVQTKRQGELQQNTGERERVLAEQLETIGKLENEITELSTSQLGKILNYFQLRKLRADVIGGQRTYEELKQQQNIEIAEQQGIFEKLESEETPPALQEAKRMLGNFYKGQKEKWTNSEYTEEDITKYFSEENLASLSLEYYVLLLKRFPREMVAHVTRQGIRDHIELMYHTAGEGAYADGFIKMVEDGRLRSPLGVYLVEGEKEQAIVRFLHLKNFKNKEDAFAHLRDFTNPDTQGEPGSYVDRMAVHFATEEVADGYYGSEKGNEIFVAYPSAYIASQYYFSGQLNKSGGGYWNDQWVWANEEKGMDLNAGLVFIPEETRVDRNSGSRYELDENKSPVVNQELIGSIQKVIESYKFFEFATQAREILGKFNQDWTDGNIYSHNIEARKKLEPFRLQLEQEFGITDRRIQRAILDYNFLPSLYVSKFSGEEERDLKAEYLNQSEESIKNSLRKRGILYGEAKNSISSKEFWEDYFTKNPDKRPSKIVYYKGKDPTEALWKWREEQGLNKKTPDEDVGFLERKVLRKSPEAKAGMDRFQTLAKKVIEDYFPQKEINS
ncbi:hypothetical protein KKC67_01420 [Patescibacteria group bacterium]|nr:hypothetical protein [Patescibacteria group bacterium]MBU0879320.1 hypothetical protein [Patescibacteria group bacterium]MBU0880013.1 hypothetical protein [Patescibacteria group bacterium]MBU0897826.1 hypothetical protein [Patescibacteria group bacterium]MBU1062781.1 hypothetical protein [Patescibacteria group bacterium]